jgi:hypothetical protein
MDEIAQYRKYTDEYRGLAATAKNPEHQKLLLEIGQGLGNRCQTEKERACSDDRSVSGDLH